MATKRAKTTQQHRLNNKLDDHSTPPATPLPPASRRRTATSRFCHRRTSNRHAHPKHCRNHSGRDGDLTGGGERVLRDKNQEYLGKDDNDHDATWWSTTSAESYPKKKE
ncbi:unnamed protein product [Macrosiphum euphorbiae]|uniref:Uncharacterized protein n=1 Tax=Macrosiphum euphorbiae TaxID=13131 RepID=A0AAV0X3K1_9HEMI|nr:unnamed protein product [Macrosiphum euphorbiae]